MSLNATLKVNQAQFIKHFKTHELKKSSLQHLC